MALTQKKHQNGLGVIGNLLESSVFSAAYQCGLAIKSISDHSHP